MGMPFSVIFSIILIVVFIVVAFIAIRYFLDIGDCGGVGLFYDELQKSVEEAWASQSSEFGFEGDVPSGIEKVCFADLSSSITGGQEDYQQIRDYDVYEANFFLIPSEKSCNMPYKMINRVNISKITASSNPYCVDVLDGKVELRIKKDFYDKEVFIS